ncbi:hypothetical protein C1646_662591 [Rhizophagus diaphanus]|nr:hypothetical protein C1646_662591 [Rhizophagus diaphanus] [Rhizophagus sp. MUCL 43196]
MSGMEEATDMSVFISLLMRVARAFFQTQHIVVLDQLTKQEAMSDENLAKGVGLNVKEIHKLCGTLKEARLIKTFTKAEPKKAEQRAIPRTYYYVDWQQVVNVIKWKIFKIREMVGDRMRSEQENKGYLCPGCKKVFAPLDVHNLFDPIRQTFICDLCHSELDHNDNAENVKGSEKLHGRFMEQSKPIIDLLKTIDKLRIPVQQNALPAWHVRSTVSGEMMVSNAWNSGANKEIEEQKVENIRVNEKEDEGHGRYLEEYYANYNQDTESPNVEEIDDDDFEEVEIEEEFEEVEMAYNSREDEDDDVDLESSHRYDKRLRTDDGYGKYSENGNRKINGSHY